MRSPTSSPSRDWSSSSLTWDCFIGNSGRIHERDTEPRLEALRLPAAERRMARRVEPTVQNSDAPASADASRCDNKRALLSRLLPRGRSFQLFLPFHHSFADDIQLHVGGFGLGEHAIALLLLLHLVLDHFGQDLH